MLFFFPGTTNAQEDTQPPLFLYNTLSRAKEAFTPLRRDFVRMYHCGPTVYDYAHIGNLRAYVFADTLRRVLRLNEYKVRQVMNVTDVGHLTSDADAGEDKMTVGLRREGLPLTLEGMHTLAERYTLAFLKDLDFLLIRRPDVLPKASEHISAQIALIETLMEKEYAYRTRDGVYFDTARFEGYGKLGGIDVSALREGARVEVNPEKRNSADFALWKKDDTLGWESPWGKGFPGWHIECSAMSMEYLGKELDIHTGGIDHIPVHHNNEIAQSEAATGRSFARFWMHCAFVNIEGTKFSKSLRNTITLRQLVERGFHPLAYRYWLLTGHYRSPMNFTWDALEGAQTALTRLQRIAVEHLREVPVAPVDESFALSFRRALNDDLNTPQALALLWDTLKGDEVFEHKRAALVHADRCLGLGIRELFEEKGAVQVGVVSEPHVPDEVRALVDEREVARREKDFDRADQLRDRMSKLGYHLEDTSDGSRITRAREAQG